MHYFTIVRHGQTPSNVTDTIQTRTGGELTPLGENMAKSLGRHLKAESFTRIFSSDLHRCRQTTEGILSQMTTETPPVEYTRALRERDYGDWEFLSGSVVRAKRQEMNLPYHKLHHVDVPYGESHQECAQRVKQFFSKICEIVDESDEGRSENILAVSHGIFIMMLIEHLRSCPLFTLKMEANFPILRKGMENTCRTRLAISSLQPGDGLKREVTITHLLNSEHIQDCKI